MCEQASERLLRTLLNSSVSMYIYAPGGPTRRPSPRPRRACRSRPYGSVRSVMSPRRSKKGAFLPSQNRVQLGFGLDPTPAGHGGRTMRTEFLRANLGAGVTKADATARDARSTAAVFILALRRGCGSVGFCGVWAWCSEGVSPICRSKLGAWRIEERGSREPSPSGGVVGLAVACCAGGRPAVASA